MKKTNIGIVGLGYVGNACYKTFKESSFSINTFDINRHSTCNSLNQLVRKSKIIFVCLPTPMKKNGQCDISIIDKCLMNICQYSNSTKIIVIKSTIPPGTTLKFEEKYPNLNFVFNPEFLREKTHVEDFKNQKFIILGGNHNQCSEVKKFYKNFFPDTDYLITKSNAAELIKYTINTFLATKVSFANEIYSLSRALNIDYNEMIKIAQHDTRIGHSHWKVPGEDGKYGYGGSCFPKDVSSIIYEMNERNIRSYIIKASQERNVKLDRNERDWEMLKGRAVTDDNLVE